MNQAAVKEALTHGAVRPEWVRPDVPDGYTKVVLCEYGFARELDYYNEFQDEFFSADQGVALNLPMPWQDGFNPTNADWNAIGIEVIDFRSAFA